MPMLCWTCKNHRGALTSRISCVRLMFIAQTSSHLIFTTSMFRHRSCIPFTIPSVMPAFPTLSLFLTLIPIPCSRRSSSRGSASSAADGGAEAASLPRPLLCRRAAELASPSPVAQHGSRVQPTRWRGSWAGVGTKISPGEECPAAVLAPGGGSEAGGSGVVSM